MWEHMIIDWWLHLTPVILVAAAVILGCRLVVAKKYRSRMARASFFLLTSYAILMVRVLTGSYDPDDGDTAPLPIFALLYLWASLYFLYALILEWFVPFLIWLRDHMNDDPQKPVPDTLGETFDA